MASSMELSAVVLSGGENRRMDGLDKAFLVIDRSPIIEDTLSLLRADFAEVLVVTNSPDRYVRFGVKTVEDEIKGIGPLGGIYTGLKMMKNIAGLFVACDLPFLNADILRRLKSCFSEKRPACLVPRHQGGTEPLCSIYSRSILPLVEQCIQAGRLKLKDLLMECGQKAFLDLEGNWDKIFFNLNSNDDWKKIKGEE
ncbi:MAG: molybdenum cofactor guanylyltransferase [Candidatus Omnitrophota bacterium]